MPYEHHQNGKVEHTTQTLAEEARSMLLQEKLPPRSWTFAFRHAAWVHNRVLHAGLDVTPYELAIKRRPSLFLLQVFGCSAILHNMVQKKDMSPKAKRVIYLGVAQDSQGWIFYNPKSKNLLQGASAVFHEDDFLPHVKDMSVNKLESQHIFNKEMIYEMQGQDTLYGLLNISSYFCTGTLMTYKEVKISPQAKKWMTVCKEELKNMKNMGVWEVVNQPEKKGIFGTRWIFATKLNAMGEVTWHKARLVVQGHRQIKGLNFEETFAPTSSFATLRLILAIASTAQWKIATFDMTAAYLHSPLNKDIYVRPPPGIDFEHGKVLKLRKALYGLKQAGRCWWLHLKEVLKKMGFKTNEEDQSTYILKWGTEKSMLWIHMDYGILAAETDSTMEFLQGQLARHLNLRWDKELSSTVGIEVKQHKNRFYLSQSALIGKLMTTLENEFTTYQPLPDVKLESSKAVKANRLYLSAIGMLLYLAQATRPDIIGLDSFKTKLTLKFKLHLSNHVSKIVGLNIDIGTGRLDIRQPLLTKQLLDDYHRPIRDQFTTLPDSLIVTNEQQSVAQTRYQSILGSLMYLSLGSQPDITFAVNSLARFSSNPGLQHWEALDHLIGYLCQHRHQPLIYDKKDQGLSLWTNANWGGEHKRSTSGFMVKAFDNLIAWGSKRQHVVAMSTCASEYVAPVEGEQLLAYIRLVAKPILSQLPRTIHCDNKAAIMIAKDNLSKKRTKYLDRAFYFVIDFVRQFNVKLQWTPTAMQYADVLIKPLGHVKMGKARASLNLATPDITLGGDFINRVTRPQSTFRSPIGLRKERREAVALLPYLTSSTVTVTGCMCSRWYRSGG
ncbi:hypothetical protein O181_091670, partial [Austropuccinia psidii MF-1]|nr:hypothetical protein [Austropuccinia psidii MF-1]